jgi:putative NIF3 family GTP cyclohydrolase 1 type 2
MGLTTAEILQVALEAAQLSAVPADSMVIVPGDNLKKVAFGVDMETAELLIAREIGVDGVITHHPVTGAPKLNLFKVMENQIERMVSVGVPVNKAQKALKPRMEEVDRGLHVSNYDRVTSAAKALKMPFLAIHSPADLLGERFIQAHLDRSLAGNPQAKLKDVLTALLELTEYKLTLAKPTIRVGSEGDYAGKVLVTMAGGTSGGVNVYKAYFEAGVGTLVVMHTPENVIKAIKEQNIGNVIVAGHMASDSVGINLLITALQAKGLEVVRMSGVIDPAEAE